MQKYTNNKQQILIYLFTKQIFNSPNYIDMDENIQFLNVLSLVITLNEEF